MSLQLAAVWVKDHHILGTIGVSLGGAYLYHFEEKDDHLHISRKENKKYIKKFYADDSPNLNLVSCVVGKNGSGKTTLLSVIRSILKNGQGFGGFIDAYVDGILIFEKNNHEVIIKRDSYDRKMGFEDMLTEGQKKIIFCPQDIIISTTSPLIETVHYSPFLGLDDSYLDFSSSPDIDISLDRIIQSDNYKADPKGHNNLLLEHKYQNTYRQFDYQGHPISDRFNKEYGVPIFASVLLDIRSPGFSSKSFHNTPSAFRPFYEKLYDIWQEEINATNRNVSATTNLEEDKKIFSLWILHGLINSIFLSMEASNRFLDEGEIDITSDVLDGFTLVDALVTFLEKHYFIKIKNVELPKKEIQILIEVVNEILDAVQKGDITSTQTIHLDFEKAKSILEAHKNFLSAMINFDQNAIGFIDIKTNENLSSGEKAYLDLFSRFLFSTEEIDARKTRLRSPLYKDGKVPNHFILLIDEGDMGFHPVWKKKYVDTLISILPKFFEKYHYSTIQIIFTTHDGLTLSDIPNHNVVYLDKKNDSIKVLDQNIDKTVPQHSFGANISELLTDSFFLSDGLVGEFAKKKINKTIKWLNKGGQLDEIEYHQKVIELIDEPIIQTKLAEMFALKTGQNILETKILEEQIARLQSKLDDLNSPS